jgi:hypothetical protein
LWSGGSAVTLTPMATSGATSSTPTVEPAAGRSPSGWFRDPSGRHEARWYSVGMPTKLVRDGSTEGYDPTPVLDLSPPQPVPSGTDGRVPAARAGTVRALRAQIVSALSR